MRELQRISHSSIDSIQKETAEEISNIAEGKNSNKLLQYLFAEVFFTSTNFKEAVGNVYALFVLLARLRRFVDD